LSSTCNMSRRSLRARGKRPYRPSCFDCFQDRDDLMLTEFAPLHPGLLGSLSYPETSTFQWSSF
jgi:hypothetical protein